MKIQCPHCDTIFNDISDNLVNQIVTCSNCQEEFVAEDIDAPEPPPQQYQPVSGAAFTAKNHHKIDLSAVQTDPARYYNSVPSAQKIKIHWSIHVYNGVALIPFIFGFICLCVAPAVRTVDVWQRIGIAAFGLSLFLTSGVLIAFGRLLVNVEKIEQYLRNKD